MLIVMCGLPGVGKSALAEELGRSLPAAVLSVDPVEAAMWRAGIDRGQPTGLAAYAVVEALAGEILALGQTAIVDAVNDVEAARQQWRVLARRCGVALRYVEVICSDQALHRRRLEGRRRNIVGFAEPGWESLQLRRAGFAAWREPRLVLDSTADQADNLRTAKSYLADADADAVGRQCWLKPLAFRRTVFDWLTEILDDYDKPRLS